jgi:hypothetical protein
MTNLMAPKQKSMALCPSPTFWMYTTAERNGSIDTMTKIKGSLAISFFVFNALTLAAVTTLAADKPDLSPAITSSQFTRQATDLYQSLDKDRDGLLQEGEAKKLPKWLANAKPGDKGQTSIISVMNAADATFKSAAKTNPHFLTTQEYKDLKDGK